MGELVVELLPFRSDAWLLELLPPPTLELLILLTLLVSRCC